VVYLAARDRRCRVVRRAACTAVWRWTALAKYLGQYGMYVGMDGYVAGVCAVVCRCVTCLVTFLELFGESDGELLCAALVW